MEITQRPPRCPFGHSGDPGDEHSRREMDQLRHLTTDRTSHQAGPQPPHHDQAGDGNGEQVGRDSSDRQTPEAAQDDRRDTDLCGQGDRQHLRQRAGTGKRAP